MSFLRAAPSLSSVFNRETTNLSNICKPNEFPFVAFDGAKSYSDGYGANWMPEGHSYAERLLRLLSENKITQICNLSRKLRDAWLPLD